MSTGESDSEAKNRVRHISFSKGHAMMWRSISMVRDINFTRIEPVHIGKMTRDTWNTRSDARHS